MADRPGWTGTPGGTWHYVLGDGAVVGPRDVPPTEVIVAFEPDAKFTRRGKLGDWQAAMEPVVAGQTLPVFVLCLALAPPLLTLAPPDFGNQLCEIAGPSGHGKSTLAFLAASVWAGDPARETLGAESWLTTLEAIERQMAVHADALLVLDEANKAGSSRKTQRELIEKAIFRLSGTEGKARHGTGVEVSGARLLTISTSNEPLAQLLKVTPAVMEALQARMVTFEVSWEGPLRAFDRVPHGFASERKAVEALLRAIATYYGTPGRAMVVRLVQERAADEPKLRRRIPQFIAHFYKLTGAGDLAGSAGRAAKLFALAYAAGRLAREWGILPEAWGMISKLVPRLYALWRSAVGGAAGAAQLLRAHLDPTRERWIDAASVKSPLKLEDFRATAGILVREETGSVLLVPSPMLRSGLPGCLEVMRALRDAGVVEGEEGQQRKLTRKAPRRLVDGPERVYRIRLDRLDELLESGG